MEGLRFWILDSAPFWRQDQYNPTVKDTAITMVCNIFKKVKGWEIDHDGEEAPDVMVISEDDTDEWLTDAAASHVYCPRDFCSFHRVTTDGFEAISHTDIQKDDCIQGNIRFAPYGFLTSKRAGVAGIKIIMEEVVVIKKLRSVTRFNLFSISIPSTC